MIRCRYCWLLRYYMPLRQAAVTIRYADYDDIE